MTKQEKERMLARIYEVIAIKRNWKLHSISMDWNVITSEYFPVMIGDCLDCLDSQEVQKIDWRHPAQRSLLILWKSKRLPIDEQSDECIDYIYSLIK